MKRVGTLCATVQRHPRSPAGFRNQLCPCSDQPCRPVLNVLNLESHSDLPFGQMSDLDFIDHPTLRRVSKLERRPTRIENHDTGVPVPLIGRLLWQPQCIAIEPHGGFVIVDLDYDS